MPSETQDSNGTEREMPDAPANGDAASQDRAMRDAGMQSFEQRLRVLPGESNTAATFQFYKEDHTLGNALRYVIMKNPDVEFCGYSIPHPSDPKMNLRIQTYDNVSVYAVLDKGLQDLMDICEVVTEKFEAAKDAFPKEPAAASPASRGAPQQDMEDA